MKRLGILIVIGLAFGCSPQKRLSRIISNHPYLLTTDTVTVSDTTIIEAVRSDTIVSYESLLDTVYITEDRLKVRVVRVADSIYIKGECDTDTIIKTIEVPYEKIVIQPLTWWQRHKAWIFVALGAIGLMAAKRYLPI